MKKNAKSGAIGFVAYAVLVTSAFGSVGCSSTAVTSVPRANRTANVERIEHYSEPNAVDYGNFFLNYALTLKSLKASR